MTARPVRRRWLIGLVAVLAPVNLILFATETFPFDVLADWHRAVGLRYSGLMVVAMVGLMVAQMAAILAVVRLVAPHPAAPPTLAAPPVSAPETLWLPHHDVHARVLRLPRTGPGGAETDRSQAPRLDRGYYVSVPGGFAGMFDTAQGPVFFLDDRRIPLDDSVRCTVTPGRRRSVFRLWRGDSLDVDLSYAPPTDIDVGDAFSSAFDRDFFVWLAESHAEGRHQPAPESP
ncbi:hypothetical protein [Roseospira navarrensis]|uniref:Uncharacterized protein n=1 Tax=Roseospira navarrensis TaxID=140058 RepID=A0A7X1ZEK1_9PROT|nr:hypothetical protein [Roseospira navarrensis]MQX35805.1 hypothetical protein [Roseospira navarrensis]